MSVVPPIAAPAVPAALGAPGALPPTPPTQGAPGANPPPKEEKAGSSGASAASASLGAGIGVMGSIGDSTRKEAAAANEGSRQVSQGMIERSGKDAVSSSGEDTARQDKAGRR